VIGQNWPYPSLVAGIFLSRYVYPRRSNLCYCFLVAPCGQGKCPATRLDYICKAGSEPIDRKETNISLRNTSYCIRKGTPQSRGRGCPLGTKAVSACIYGNQPFDCARGYYFVTARIRGGAFADETIKNPPTQCVRREVNVVHGTLGEFRFGGTSRTGTQIIGVPALARIALYCPHPFGC